MYFCQYILFLLNFATGATYVVIEKSIDVRVKYLLTG